jgi:hypothetical protein
MCWEYYTIDWLCWMHLEGKRDDENEEMRGKLFIK